MSVHRRVVERASRGTVSSVVVSPLSTVGTNWSVVDSACRLWGPTAMIWVRVQRINTALAPDAEGDFTNEVVARFTADCRGTVTTLQPLTSGQVGRVAAGYYDPVQGQIWLTAAGGAGDAIDVGEEITLGGTVYLR